jgi:PAS domain S-box-containing protein
MTRKRPSQESSGYFRSLINHSQIAITVIDADGRLVLFSQGAEKLTGYSSDEVIGKHISAFYPDSDVLASMQTALLKDGKIENLETEVLRRDGTTVPILISISVLKDKEGNPTGSIGVSTDMSQIKETMRSLHRLEDLHADTIANIDEVIFVMDCDLNILDVNNRVFELTHGRHERKDLIGKNLKDMFAFTVTDGVVNHYKKVLHTGAPVVTVENVESDGHDYYYEVRRLPIKDKEGNIARMLCVLKDITETKEIHEEILARNRELAVINDIAATVSMSLKLDDILGAALDKSMEILGKSQSGIFLHDDETNCLRLAACRNIPASVLGDESGMNPENCLCGYAFRKGELVQVKDYDKDDRFTGSRKKSNRVIVVPIPHHERMLGVMFFYPDRESEPSESELRLLTAVGHQVGVAIENAHLYQKLQDSYLETIKALALAVDAKDPYTRDHSEKVRKWAVKIAESLGLTEDSVRDINYASLLHDLGKLSTSELVLNKPGKLTDEEYEEIRQHPLAGSKMLTNIPILKGAQKIVLCHHEFFGGGGYPHGMRGRDIPLGSRIIAVADAFEAMTADRPYRPALDRETAKRKLRELGGTQFDPEIVEIFLSILEEDEKESK